MHLYRLSTHFPLRRVLLVFVWLFGLILGCYFATVASSNESIHIVRQVLQSEPSIIGLFISLIIPLVTSFLAIKLRLNLLILPIAFIKAVCFSFCAMCLIFAFGDAGWLLCRLYVFSDSCAVVVLLLFWIHCIPGDVVALNKNFCYCLVSISAICFVDYFLVSPFAMKLFYN